MHYGTPKHSGRYPYGSGERPYQGDERRYGVDPKVNKALHIGMGVIGTIGAGALGSVMGYKLSGGNPEVTALAGVGAAIIPSMQLRNTMETPLEQFKHITADGKYDYAGEYIEKNRWNIVNDVYKEVMNDPELYNDFRNAYGGDYDKSAIDHVDKKIEEKAKDILLNKYGINTKGEALDGYSEWITEDTIDALFA